MCGEVISYNSEPKIYVTIPYRECLGKERNHNTLSFFKKNATQLQADSHKDRCYYEIPHFY